MSIVVVTPTLVAMCRAARSGGLADLEWTGATFCNKASQQYESRLSMPLSFPSIWLLTHRLHHKKLCRLRLRASLATMRSSTACLNINDRVDMCHEDFDSDDDGNATVT